MISSDQLPWEMCVLNGSWQMNWCTVEGNRGNLLTTRYTCGLQTVTVRLYLKSTWVSTHHCLFSCFHSERPPPPGLGSLTSSVPPTLTDFKADMKEFWAIMHQQGKSRVKTVFRRCSFLCNKLNVIPCWIASWPLNSRSYADEQTLPELVKNEEMNFKIDLGHRNTKHLK